jgi:serine protease Do
LVEEGRVAHGFVGVIMRELDEAQASRYRLPHNRGVQITKLVEGGPADQAGLQVDDFLVSINGRAVRKSSDVVSVIAQLPPGREADLVFYRSGDRQSTVVTVGQRPQDIVSAFSGLMTKTITPALAGRWDLPPDSRGALVTEVLDDSPADQAGLQRGMLVTHANGRQIDSADELRALMASPLARSGLRLRVQTKRGAVMMVVLQY